MAKKSKSKPTKSKLAAVKSGVAKAAKASPIGRVAGAVAAVKGIGGGAARARGMRGRRGKKSAYWYAAQIQRLKLKRKYDKLRLGVSVR